MRTSADFRPNPIETFFDPEKVYQAYASGQSFEELQPAIRAGKFLPDSIPRGPQQSDEQQTDCNPYYAFFPPDF